MENTIELVNKTREEALTKIKAYARPKTIMAIVEIIMCFVVSMGIELISFKFSLDAFKDYHFYVSLFCTTACVLLIYRATINARFYKTETRDIVLEAKKEYKAHNNKKGLDLKDFLNEYNLKRKVEIYISGINAKIFKLEKKQLKATAKNKIKRIQKLQIKIDFFKGQRDDPALAEKITRIPVKQTLVFFSDFNECDEPFSSEISTRSNYAHELNKATFQKVYMYIISSILLGIGISSAASNGGISLVISLLSNVFFCCTRVGTALLQADSIYDRTILKSIYDRTTILKYYEEWQIEHKTPSKVEELRDELKQELKVEYEVKAKKMVEAKIKEIESQLT